MTYEEAIEYNKNLREYMRITDKYSKYKFLKENYEALEMAIKVLESKTKIVTCKDCKHGINGICPNYRDFVDEDFYCASAERCYK